jgi:hypothetical protein
MNYIRTYENYSLDNSYEDAISIFDPLRDYGYTVEVDKETTDDWKINDGIEDYLSLSIFKDLGDINKLNFDVNVDTEESLELTDCVLRLIDFLKDWSYNFECVDGSSYLKSDINIKDDKFIYSRSGDVVNKSFHKISLFFTRKDKVLQESLVDDVSDRFFDLENEGYSVNTRSIKDKRIDFKGEKRIHNSNLGEFYIGDEEID